MLKTIPGAKRANEMHVKFMEIECESIDSCLTEVDIESEAESPKSSWTDPQADARAMHDLSAFRRAEKRVGSILVTMGIELLVALIIIQFTGIISRHPELVAFMPIISAVSGNVGLQSSTIITRGIAMSYVNPERWHYAIFAELHASLYLAVACSISLGILSWFWVFSISHVLVIMFSQFISILTSAVTGSVAPILGKSLGYDPAAFAGPMETAIQDIVGNSVFLFLATLILDSIGE